MATEDTMREMIFVVSGGFDVSDDLEPIHAANGAICGFRTPEGDEVKLIVGLESAKDERRFRRL